MPAPAISLRLQSAWSSVPDPAHVDCCGPNHHPNFKFNRKPFRTLMGRPCKDISDSDDNDPARRARAVDLPRRGQCREQALWVGQGVLARILRQQG